MMALTYFLGRTTVCSVPQLSDLWQHILIFLQINELSGCPNTTPWLLLQQCLGVHWYSGLGQLFNTALHGFLCWALKQE